MFVAKDKSGVYISIENALPDVEYYCPEYIFTGFPKLPIRGTGEVPTDLTMVSNLSFRCNGFRAWVNLDKDEQVNHPARLCNRVCLLFSQRGSEGAHLRQIWAALQDRSAGMFPEEALFQGVLCLPRDQFLQGELHLRRDWFLPEVLFPQWDL